jgi:hypothetical protein
MTVHHCPQCELTFSFKTELEWHLREEHAPPVDPWPIRTTTRTAASTNQP